jgi:hypothetical protein
MGQLERVRDLHGEARLSKALSRTRSERCALPGRMARLSIYSYATAMNGLADEQDLRLRFDAPTKTRQPEFHRYWTTRDQAANVRLSRLAAEILAALEAGVFPPRVGWHCRDCPVRSRGVGMRSAPPSPMAETPTDPAMPGLYPFVNATAPTFRWAPRGKCWSSRRVVESPHRGMARALPPGHTAGLVPSRDQPAPSARAHCALPDHRGAPPA